MHLSVVISAEGEESPRDGQDDRVVVPRTDSAGGDVGQGRGDCGGDDAGLDRLHAQLPVV